MNPVRNPFAPGAGTRPPDLAGRETILNEADVAFQRLRIGRAARGQLLLGLRGVGKTVLLNRIAELAEGRGCRAVLVESPEDRRLAEMLVPHLRQLLFGLSRLEQAKELARQGLGILRAFAKTFKVKVGDVEFTVESATGTADSGNLEADLPEVFMSVAQAAHAAGTVAVLLIDEVQYLPAEDLAALIVSVHKVAQRGLPLIVFGAGLPQLAGLAGQAKSYAERLFSYPDVGPLAGVAAREALTGPVDREGVKIADDAVAEIVRLTEGYPYFLQEWGYHSWNLAQAGQITKGDVDRATPAAVKQLDANFFKVRMDRLTPRETDYLRAMATLGPGAHRSGIVADELGKSVKKAGSLRDTLIKKGMIYSPQYGDTAFTVPMFDQFMVRYMPDWQPTNPSHIATPKEGRPSGRGTRKTK